MAIKQKYGIKYPLTNNNNDNLAFDLNHTSKEYIKSMLFHLIMTPKGQKIRDLDFGTDLPRFIFENKTDLTLDKIKKEITTQVGKYIPQITFDDVTIKNDESSNGVIIIVHYHYMNTQETVALKF